MIQVDGSYLEGGGSIVRVACALSCITGKPARVFNIRKNRPQAGLKTQHLQGVLALADLCNARLVGAKKGSESIEFYPGKIDKEKIEINIGTAGSIGLVFQTLAIPASKTKDGTNVYLHGGGTFGKYSPPLVYTQKLLLPTLKKMGYNAEINITKHGFYPTGGAEVNMKIHPLSEIKPIQLVDHGEIEVIEGLSIASSDLKKPKVAERQAQGIREYLKNYKTDIKSRYVDSACSGSGVVLWAKTSTGALLGADSLGEKGKKSESVAEEAAMSMIGLIKSKAAVDRYLADQLLIFMALAKGRSEVIVPEITNHTKTNIWVIKKFLDVEFEISPHKITCSGS